MNRMQGDIVVGEKGRRALWSKLALFFCSFLLALVFAEGLVRYARPVQTGGGGSDPVLLYRLYPGGDIDARGFRNPKALSHASVVAIGDSQTYGNQAASNEAWPAQLGELMGTSTYEMAVGGYGPIQYNSLFDEALALKPDVIIVGLYLGNDIFDAYYLPYEKDETGHWASLTSTSSREEFARLNLPPFPYDTVTPKSEFDRLHNDAKGILRLRVYLRDHSALYALLGNATRSFRERLGWVKTHEEEVYDQAHAWAKKNPTISYELNAEGVDTIFTTAYRDAVLDPKDPRILEGLRITKEMLKAMESKAGAHGVHLVIAIIPTKEMAYGAYVHKNHLSVSSVYERLLGNEAHIRTDVLAYCQKNQLDCVDVSGSLSRSILDGTRVYPRTHDGHPRPPGYSVIARALSQHLIEEARTPK